VHKKERRIRILCEGGELSEQRVPTTPAWLAAHIGRQGDAEISATEAAATRHVPQHQLAPLVGSRVERVPLPVR
jgi:hypothetical protein